MKLTRRSIFPLAAVGIIPAADGSQGASLDPQNAPGILVRIAWMGGGYGGWSALVPDFEAMNNYWRPGMVAPVKWMPLQEYLELVEETYRTEQA